MFNDKGSIEIGTAGNMGSDGIDNSGTFNNSTSTAYINIASDNILKNNGTSPMQGSLLNTLAAIAASPVTPV